MNLIFQSQKPQIANMYDEVSASYREILKCYMDANYITGTAVEKIDPSNRARFLVPQQMYLGVDAQWDKRGQKSQKFFLQNLHLTTRILSK